MSAGTSGQSVCPEQSVSSLLAGRVVKRPRLEEGERLQEAALRLLEQQQNLRELLREVENLDPRVRTSDQNPAGTEDLSPSISGSLLVSELQRCSAQLDLPLTVLSVQTILQRLMEICGPEDQNQELLTSCQRVQVCVLLESSAELMSQGLLCPRLLWQEYRREQSLPNLELVYLLHRFQVLPLRRLLQSDEGVRFWLVARLKSLCSWRHSSSFSSSSKEEEEQSRRVQLKVLTTLVQVLVGCGFQQNSEPAASDQKKISLLCCSIMDHMLYWLLDSVDRPEASRSDGAGGSDLWTQVLDASVCGVRSEAALRFFTHCLTQTLTYKPALTVSDAVALQNHWTFARAAGPLTSLLRKLSVTFSVEQLLSHLQQVLETHEVNWKHVLCFLSTLLVYNPEAPPTLTELLSRLLTSAFAGYDPEHLVTVFLLARQAALTGPHVFCSYSHWFKMCFGGSSGFHGNSKKSLVFLLKFLSDLVPFEPPQYLKVHLLHPPFVPVKQRSLLMEYVSLAKTRLADLKESVEDMGLYEDISAAGGASGSVQPQCQAVQDVEKAVALFESTGRISATVMEASIFRRPYFLSRFLPALLTPRVLPVEADARINLIEALQRAEKIPAALLSAYMESCRTHTPQHGDGVCVVGAEDPLEVLTVQLQEFRKLVVDGNDGDMMAQLSRISHTLDQVFTGPGSDPPSQQTVLTVHVDSPLSSELHVQMVGLIIRSFCQCLLEASQRNPPNQQNLWASRLVSVLLSNCQLTCSLVHRLWNLLRHQGAGLSSAHVLGLAALLVHLHAAMPPVVLIDPAPPLLPTPVPVGEALSAALLCDTHTHMVFCVRLCVSAVCYGMCRGDEQQQQDFVPSFLYKKLLFLVPRLLPEVRRWSGATEGPTRENPEGNLWSGATDSGATWRETALSLWRHAGFRMLENSAEYQLPLSHWLIHELNVQRSCDALTDPERQEYQQWACLDRYLTRVVADGGCGGNMRTLCSELISAIMDQELTHRTSGTTGTCLPDILARLQECVCELQEPEACDFLFRFISQRCPSSESCSVSSELHLQHTLHTWNRVLLSLPPPLLLQVKTDGGQTSLDCTRLMEHVNLHQRKACSPPGLMSFHLTSHLLRGVLCASVRCGCPREEVNKVWTQISVHCPLLLNSAVHWWERLCPVLSSLWARLTDGDKVSEQLQLLSQCRLWAHSVKLPPSALPEAPPLLLAASLHQAWCGRGQSLGSALKVLRAERSPRERQVLVLLLFLCVNDHLSALLLPQNPSAEGSRGLFWELLSVLADSSDWLFIFKAEPEPSVYGSVTMVTTDEVTRLMPWAFYSLLLGQGAELQQGAGLLEGVEIQQGAGLLQRVERCPGFLPASVLCYVRLLQLFLDGHALAEQLDPPQLLGLSKSFVLRVISQAPPAALSAVQRRTLEAQTADLDPDVSAALRLDMAAPSLSPEMDFL